MNTKDRLKYHQVSPEAVKTLSGFNTYHQESTIDARLRYLVELRVSQINGCVYCIDLHSRQAREAGEDQQRLDCLPAWHEAPFYTERERAALEWAETVTLVSQNHVPDDVYVRTAAQFTDRELVDLTMIVVGMNAWNRMAISFRLLPARKSQ